MRSCLKPMAARGALLAVAMLFRAGSAAAIPPPPPPPGAPVIGTVLTPEGKPAPGVKVYTTRFWFEREVDGTYTSDSQGHFTIPRGLDPDSPLILAPEHGAITFAATSSRGPVLRLAAATDLRLRFTNGAGGPLAHATVAVFPTADAGPLKDVVVDRAFPRFAADLQPRLMGQTDANGALDLAALPAGQRVSVTVQAVPNTQAAVLQGSLLLGPGAVTAPLPVEFAMNGSLAGSVTFHSTGKPVPGVHLELIGPGYHNFMAFTDSGAAGNYHFDGLAPAGYMVMPVLPASFGVEPRTGRELYLTQVRDAKGQWLPPNEYSDFTVRRGQHVTGADIMVVKGAVITCKVVDASGRPVFASHVMVQQPDGSGDGTSTGIDGTCRFVEAPGKVKVIAGQGVFRGAHSAMAKDLLLREGEEVTVVLSPAGATTAPGPALRAAAPDIRVQAADGRTLRLADFRGKVVLLAFWFPEPGSSMADPLKTANDVVQQVSTHGVIGLAVDTSDDREEFDRWIYQHAELDALQFALDPSDWHRTGQGAVSTAYAVSGWLVFYVIGPDGTLVRRFEGDPKAQALRDAVLTASRTPSM